MADGLPTVDTSSYPKAGASPSVLDTVGKLQGLEQQSISIDQNKLKLVNDRYGIMSKELQGLMGDPDVDFNKVAARYQNLVNLGLMDSKMMAHSLQDVPTDKAKIPEYLKMKALQAGSIVEALNATYGAPKLVNNGQQDIPSREGVFVKGGIQRDPQGVPFQRQVPPTAEVRDTNPTLPNGQPNPGYGSSSLQGPQAEQPTPGLPVARPAGAPQMAPRPTAPINPSPLPVGTDTLPDGSTRTVGPNTAPRYSPSGLSTGMPPLFEEGKKQYVEDQNLATQKLTAIKPAIQALPLIKGLTTGIGSETYNKALAGLSNLGLVSQGQTDKAAIYQELTKKLANYVSNNPVGQRSDAAQTLAEAASPSPKAQINPALIKLTKDAVILDRVQAARANAFEGQDYSKYGEHRSTFPAKVDERAFGIDLMDPEERGKLLSDMNKKLNSSKAAERAEGQKFRRSLAIVDKLGYIDLSE